LFGGRKFGLYSSIPSPQSTILTMNLFRHFIYLVIFLGLIVAATAAEAAGVVELDLVGDARSSAMTFQDWSQLLGKAGIRNFRFRVVQDTDKVGIETRGTDQSPIYVVTGVVSSRDELMLPGGRFRRSDMARLAQWINDLAEHGPVVARQKKAAFGLFPAQFDKVRAELAVPVGFATRRQTGRQIVERIAEGLKSPLKLDAEAAESLAGSTLDEDLSGLSAGTVLAYVLRSAGYGLAPQATGHEPGVTYRVVRLQADIEVWPVGWPSEKSPQQAIPALFEFHNVNVQNVSAATALEAIGKRLHTAVLLDYGALTRHGIDPVKLTISLPSARTTYSQALRKLLFQARMKYEIRYDEAGTPLLWVTSIKPG
jgi:hypothetical protein